MPPITHCERSQWTLKPVFSKCTTCCSRSRRCRKAVSRNPDRFPTPETLTAITIEAKNNFEIFFAPPVSLSSEPLLNSREARNEKKIAASVHAAITQFFANADGAWLWARRCLRYASIIPTQHFDTPENFAQVRFIIVTVTMRFVFLRARHTGLVEFQVLDSAFLLTLSKA